MGKFTKPSAHRTQNPSVGGIPTTDPVPEVLAHFIMNAFQVHRAIGIPVNRRTDKLKTVPSRVLHSQSVMRKFKETKAGNSIVYWGKQIVFCG